MPESIEEVLRRYWGFDKFLPLQKQAMECVCRGRDSIVVLPTGGGKSLCFQTPALLLPHLTLVISPLIALMKDQIDSLLDSGVPAGRLDSTMSHPERNQTYDQLRARRLKLLYVSPERLLMQGFLDFLKERGISSVAIDEAHCVSMWGHDFRPEYRKLSVLRDILPGIPIGAYTATATEAVRRDIAEQLRLDRPEILVGNFDRPNLIYRVRRRSNALRQIRDVLDRHAEESGIIYCIRRADVDDMAQTLAGHGYRVAPYHAGLTDEERKKNQNFFIHESVNIIVATVAFSMGIDKSNVRYVIHAAMPKSLEHYQQESGRAGRDGLEAECHLFFSGADYSIWKRILEDSEPQMLETGASKLGQMYRYCTGASCRHRAILQYFNQILDQENCGACDIC
jgi:ATP-dependent DNA helicase RecQ